MLVRLAGDDEAVKRFEGAFGFVAEPDGEPVEEFRVRGGGPHLAEVVGGFDEAASEVKLPHAVDDTAPGECVVGVGDPACEGGTALRFGGVVEFGEGQVESVADGRECAWGDGVTGLFDVASA